MSIQLIREAAATLRESNLQAEARAIERHLAAMQEIGPERYEKFRCRKYDDVIKDLKVCLNILRPSPQRQLSEEQGRQMEAAIFRDSDTWAAQGRMID